MNIDLTINVRALQRMVSVMLIAVLVAAASPLFVAKQVSADQFSDRSIQMSDSSVSGGSITSGVGSGTAVTYRLTFTPANTAQSMVIDFCSNDPIMNDTCTAPTGMNAGSATVSNVSGNLGGTGWTITPGTSQIRLASDANTSHDIVGATTQIVNLGAITNPSAVGTFYARIYTYANNTFGAYSSATNVGNNVVDYGGIALSTTNVITITARVQESLTFCVTSADPTSWTTTNDCSDTQVSSNLPALILGHGSPTAVLDANTIDRGNVYSQLSTNATNGAVINMHNSNACAGLSADGGTTCSIPAINSGAATPSAMAAGTAAFGLFVSTSTLSTNGVGTISPTLAYNDGTHNATVDNYYGMDNTTTAAQNTSPISVPSTYTGRVTDTLGSTVAYSTGPTYRVNTAYTFAATSALTTPAGIYTANLSLIATGTF